jgi:CRP/FNR family transcriptional regulator
MLAPMVREARAAVRKERWIDETPALGALDASTKSILSRHARLMKLAKGSRPFWPGAPCEVYLIVVSGDIRVQIVAESGREIVLYRVERGESCVLTTSCLLQHASYTAEAVCETDVVCAAIPRSVFGDLLGSSEEFRNAVLGSYAARVADLIMTFEELAFRRLDRRLARALLDRAVGDRVTATHQEIAVEVGSAREVVSRTLKMFEKRGLVGLGRGEIKLCAADRLRLIAAAM